MKQREDSMSGDIHDLVRYRLESAAQEIKDAALLILLWMRTWIRKRTMQRQ